MKKFASLVLLASTMSAVAADRNIYDLMYLPTAGTAYGLTDLNYLKGKIEGEASGFDYETDLSGYVVTQTAGYSLSDRMSLQVTMDYSNISKDLDFSNSLLEDADGEQKGISDPEVAFKYRLMEDTLTVDLLAGVTIKTGDAESESDSQDSNNKQGGNSSLLGVQVGQKMDRFQWAFFSTFERNFESKNEIKGDEDTKDDAHNEWTFVGSVLTKLAEKSFLNTNAGVQFTDEYDDNKDGNTAPETTYIIQAEYQHLLSEALLLRAGLAYNTINTGEFDDYNFTVLNLGATYQF